MQLIVLGMHRSGTSAVTRLLNLAGVYFGPEGISTDANDENPKGFWERRDVRKVCDGLLHDSGFDWWRVSGFHADAVPPEVREEHLAEFRRIVHQLDAHRPWVLKEPRLCLLFPLVRPLLEVPICIHVTREPLEVAASINVRNGFPLQAGLALWEVYTRHSIEASAGLPRLLVRYEDLMADPVAVTGRLVEDLTGLGVQSLHTPTEREITAFVEPQLRRQRSSATARGARLNAAQAKLAAAIDKGTVLRSSKAGELSAGAAEALHDFEEARDRQARLEEVQAAEAAQRDELATKTEALEQLAREAEARAAAIAQADADLQARAATIDDLREQLAEASRQLAEAGGRLTETTEQLADASGRVDELEGELEQAAEHTSRLERQRREDADRVRRADDALRSAADKVRGIRKSRVWRIAWKAMSLRQTVTPGFSRQEREPLERVLGAIDTARRALPSVGADGGDGADRPPPAGPALESAPSGAARPLPLPTRTPRTRPKVAVLAWDVGHNPLGRAYILADLLRRRFDVEIWGAQFERYGSRVWAPLRDAEIPVLSFDGMAFPDHLGVMAEVARRIDADLLWAAKPRFPSLGLGIMAKEVANRPLVLDVDDHELAFFAEDEGLDPRELESHSGDFDLSLPFERAWTRACDSVIGAADLVTVSNPALQDRYGGLIVPHARDERVFDPSRYDRDEIRRRLGLGESDRLLMFGGTPRIHKGIVEILTALERLGDDRYRVAVFGTKEFDELRPQIGALERWVLPLPYQRFADLAPLVVAADLSCVLQDPSHPVSRYQMPAKVSDALALAVPCLVSDVPPLRDLAGEGVLNVFDGSVELHDLIASIFDDYDEALARAARGRDLFLERYSYEAVSAVVAPEFERLIADPPALNPTLQTLLDVPRRLYPGAVSPADARVPAVPARVPGRPKPPMAPGEQYDLVVFWKQNDTSIYGRRQDMFLEYLERSGRFREIVHFDNPITPDTLVKTYRSANGKADQSRLVVRQTLNRLLHRRDHGHVHHRTFLHAGPRSGKLGLLRLPKRADYVHYVISVLDRYGIGTRPTVFWVYPTNYDFPPIADALDPEIVVADVVDDNRTWYTPDSPHYDRLERNYQEVLARADVVLANCEPVAEGMKRFAPEIHVVPNGCELPDPGPRPPRPKELRGITGPIIGYVGNLSSRIDIDLLDTIARLRPRWNLVFVGSAHLDKTILRLDRHRNVHFVGVKPYEETKRFVAHFDVALIPHVDNEMTRSMNPLKAFVYCAAGVPVVSTPIANIGELAELITVAEGPEQFVAAIEEALRVGRRAPALEVLQRNSWQQRVEEALRLIDEAMGVTTP